MTRGSDIILILVSILFPPAGAAIVAGCGCDLLINIALTILGYLPGLLHALWLIYTKMQAEERYGYGGYYYVGGGEYQPVNPTQGVIVGGQPPNYGAAGR